MPKICINGTELAVPEGTTILDAARKNDIFIPTLCHHPKLTPFGGCRLCLVEIKGMPKPVAACTTTAAEGMDISTSTDAIEDLRRLVLDLILSDHPQDCMTCEQAGCCTLQDLAYSYGIRHPEYPGERREYEARDGNPFIERDLEKCILCGRCVKACDEIQGVEAIDFGYRGFRSKICTTYEEDLDCEFCGQCVVVCPTGALTGKAWKQQGRTGRLKETDTVCPYCGTGCNITVHSSRNEIVRVTSREETWNEGWLCVKGRFGYRFVSSPERLRKPLIRKAPKPEAGSRKSGASELFREASWEEALELVASRLSEIKARHGADALAGLSSARCTNEENYLFQKFMRAAVGTNNVDHCARL